MARMTYHNINLAIQVGCSHLGIDPNLIDVQIFRNRDEGAIGWCHGDKEEQLIELNQWLNGNNWLEVLAHELIHAKQYQRGELEDGGPMKLYWQGNAFYVLPGMTEEQYFNQPWEREAYLGQAALQAYIETDERWKPL